LSAYADTSFLISLYTLDVHSETAVDAISEAELPLFITPFGELELTNAIQLRIFRKELTKSQGKQALALFRHDIAAGIYFQKPLLGSAFERSAHLSRKKTSSLGTRTLDILHVASALDLRAHVFYSFDLRQRTLAKSAKLHVLPVE